MPRPMRAELSRCDSPTLLGVSPFESRRWTGGIDPRICQTAAEGGDMLWRAAGIGSRKPDHAFANCHHRIGGEAPDMALSEHRAGRDIGGLGLLDGERHCLGVDVEAKAPMAVDHG